MMNGGSRSAELLASKWLIWVPSTITTNQLSSLFRPSRDSTSSFSKFFNSIRLSVQHI